MDAAPDEQVVRLRLGHHELAFLRIACSGEGYHSGAEWQFSREYRPVVVDHRFQATAGDYLCELALGSSASVQHVIRRFALTGALVTLPLEHELPGASDD